MFVFSCSNSYGSLFNILAQCLAFRFILNKSPMVLAAKGEPFKLGSNLSPMFSNSGFLFKLSDPNACTLKNS
jgi:hypothetical protein